MERSPGSFTANRKRRSDERLTFTLTDVRLDGESVSGRAYCSLYYEGEEPPELYDGAELRFEGRVYQPDGKSGAPRFDFRQWMLKNGMPFGITISKGVEVRNTPESARPQDVAGRLRRSLNAALTRVMGEEAGVASAMLFNHKEAMSEDEIAAFRTLGIAHITAVSGLHVGILAAALLPLLRRFRAGRKARFVLLALFLLAYSWLTGFSAASLRASVMFLLGLLAQGWNRKPESLSLLGTAMIVVLLLRPLDANSAGFVLFFSGHGRDPPAGPRLAALGGTPLAGSPRDVFAGKSCAPGCPIWPIRPSGDCASRWRRSWAYCCPQRYIFISCPCTA